MAAQRKAEESAEAARLAAAAAAEAEVAAAATLRRFDIFNQVLGRKCTSRMRECIAVRLHYSHGDTALVALYCGLHADSCRS